MTLPDAVWIVCGGWLQVPAVEAAHRLGLKAIVSDRSITAPAMAAADLPLVVDIYDIAGHIMAADFAADKYHIVGVFTEGSDTEVTVAALAAHLGLPGISVKAAEKCKDKSWMRDAFNAAGMTPIWYMEVGAWRDMPDFPGFPIMVKAVDNCGSRGTHRVDSAEQVEAAIADAIANSTTRTALLEEYLEGDQYSVEILFDTDGTCHYLNIVDRLFADDGVMELGHVNPAQLKGDCDALMLYTLAHDAARAVGVNFGAFKIDAIGTKNGPRVLECTARLSGGLDSQFTTPAATGRDFITAAMRVACGMPPDPEDLRVKHNRFATAWAVFPKPGRVKEIWGLPTPRTFMRVSVGDVIEPYVNCAQRPAFVVVTGDTYADTLAKAKAAADVLAGYIVTEPV